MTYVMAVDASSRETADQRVWKYVGIAALGLFFGWYIFGGEDSLCDRVPPSERAECMDRTSGGDYIRP